MSFTNMVPINIFSLLMVSWAELSGFFSSVIKMRHPPLTVLAANLARRKCQGKTATKRLRVAANIGITFLTNSFLDVLDMNVRKFQGRNQQD